MLIEHGSNVDAINDVLNTPMHCAAMSGSLDVITVLLENGGKTTTKGKQWVMKFQTLDNWLFCVTSFPACYTISHCLNPEARNKKKMQPKSFIH